MECHSAHKSHGGVLKVWQVTLSLKKLTYNFGPDSVHTAVKGKSPINSIREGPDRKNPIPI